MKTLFTLLLLSLFTLGVNAQLNQVFNFEAAQADTSWTIFANGADEDPVNDISMAANPAKNTVNNSDSVLMFIVHPDASPWVGIFTDYLDEPMAFSEEAHTLTMMVYKTIISPSAMKVESSPDGGSNIELKVENTLTEEWELLTFDLSNATGYAAGVSYNRLTVFPDFPDTRTEGTTVYMDNFKSPGAVNIKQIVNGNTKIYPNPASDVMFVQHPEMNSIAISNLLGKTVRTHQFEKANSRFIDVYDLPAGIYFITVNSVSGQATTKFVKK